MLKLSLTVLHIVKSKFAYFKLRLGEYTNFSNIYGSSISQAAGHLLLLYSSVIPRRLHLDREAYSILGKCRCTSCWPGTTVSGYRLRWCFNWLTAMQYVLHTSMLFHVYTEEKHVFYSVCCQPKHVPPSLLQIININMTYIWVFEQITVSLNIFPLRNNDYICLMILRD